jgi:hypothetical protein
LFAFVYEEGEKGGMRSKPFIVQRRDNKKSKAIPIMGREGP